MTLLGQIDPLNLASLKPATASSLAADEHTAAQTRATQLQAAVSGVELAEKVNEQQQTLAFQKELAAVNKAPTPEALNAIMTKYPKFAPGLKPGVDRLDALEKEKLAGQLMGPWAAGHNGRPDLMAGALKDLADGYTTKGMTDKATGIQNLITDVGQNPHIASLKLDAMLLAAVGPEKFKELTSQIGADSDRRKKAADALLAESKVTPDMLKAAHDKAVAEAQKEMAEAKDKPSLLAAQNKLAQINADYAQKEAEQRIASGAAAEKSSLANAAEQQRQTAEGKVLAPLKLQEQAAETEIKQGVAAGDMTPDMRAKTTLDLDTAAKDLGAKAVIARQIADKFGTLRGNSSGAIARLQESWKSLWGNEDKMTELRNLAQGVINQDLADQAQKLKPVSDTDMAILKQPLPEKFANHQLIQRYMTTLVTALEKQAGAKRDMSAWINKFRGPVDAKADVTIRGRKVAKGTPMEEFLSAPPEQPAAIHPAVAALPTDPTARLAAVNARLAQLRGGK